MSLQIQETLQNYIAEHHLDKLLKDLSTTLLVLRPKNPIPFLVDVLQSIEDVDDENLDYFHLFSEAGQRFVHNEKEQERELQREMELIRERERAKEREREKEREKEKEKDKERSSSFSKKVGFSEPPKQERIAPIDVGVNFNRKRRGSVSAESLKPTAEEKTDRIIIPKSDEARMRIFSAIANNLLFRNLESDQRQEVMDAMFERKVSQGEVVIRQGDQGDNFYVVDEGVFDIFVNGKKVVEIAAGGSFGELALMYNTPRAATVQAQTDAILWAVDRVTFRRIVMDNTFRKRKMYEGFLKTVRIFQTLENDELVKVADALEPQTFDEGDTIIEEGDAGELFYIIVEGEVVVTKKMKKEGAEDDDDEEEREINRLRSGNYFGELALLTDKPRAATVTAVTQVNCAILDTKAFIRLLGPIKNLLQRNTETYSFYAHSISDSNERTEEVIEDEDDSNINSESETIEVNGEASDHTETA